MPISVPANLRKAMSLAGFRILTNKYGAFLGPDIDVDSSESLNWSMAYPVYDDYGFQEMQLSFAHVYPEQIRELIHHKGFSDDEIRKMVNPPISSKQFIKIIENVMQTAERLNIDAKYSGLALGVSRLSGIFEESYEGAKSYTIPGCLRLVERWGKDDPSLYLMMTQWGWDLKELLDIDENVSISYLHNLYEPPLKEAKR